MHFFAKKFGGFKKKQYFCTRFWKRLSAVSLQSSENLNTEC